MNSSAMIQAVVENDMCIGCGACAAKSKNNAIKMRINDYGFYVADVKEDVFDDSIKVCPFNPNPDEQVRTENEIAALFLIEADNNNRKIGRYINTYAGHSVEHRLTSSSGGIATYALSELMRRGEIQHVISVKTASSSSIHYEYVVSSSIEQVGQAAKTKYYPVTMAEVLRKIQHLDGKVAIVGVACFIKAIRLMQVQDPEFRNKVAFLIGIICGGVKSTFFAEYLASKSGVSASEFSQPEFRIKEHSSSASDYSYGCLDAKNEKHTVKMRSVGDMWGTGLFKANACDFCDDVTTELADISLGDAWLAPYSNDGRGTNVIVTRSRLADEIIQTGMMKGSLVIEEIHPEKFIASQQGSFNHRHDGLLYRINANKHHSDLISSKRFDDNRLSILLKVVHSLRMHARKKSLVVWSQTKNAADFDNAMHRTLYWLKFFTKMSHYQRAIIKRVKKVLVK
ncbi:Coenzyme F420 hydrogenase/dehydrogenase, beta subunit C-terminal domain [Aeromonas caviae]|jgi:coenzyme F420-reducing hydrogenase beta subunit|uniref:Coenzyme F420 hydrogenase/dehydrogenase, beta subunit C-terminal domain n=1 Tax=Aeromonas sp. QDB37 TaxID=2989829 RepID=UPI0022E041F3|nr:Coenzyme F420 hydrogenase/dehydrogenase, beta subunit C-terminal domain [Aeromonas sp. QDB37]